MDFIAATTEHFQGISALVPTAEDLYPLPIKMLYSVLSLDTKARRNMMASRVINYVNHLPVDVKTSIYILNG